MAVPAHTHTRKRRSFTKDVHYVLMNSDLQNNSSVLCRKCYHLCKIKKKNFKIYRECKDMQKLITLLQLGSGWWRAGVSPTFHHILFLCVWAMCPFTCSNGKQDKGCSVREMVYPANGILPLRTQLLESRDASRHAASPEPGGRILTCCMPLDWSLSLSELQPDHLTT